MVVGRFANFPQVENLQNVSQIFHPRQIFQVEHAPVLFSHFLCWWPIPRIVGFATTKSKHLGLDGVFGEFWPLLGFGEIFDPLFDFRGLFRVFVVGKVALQPWWVVIDGERWYAGIGHKHRLWKSSGLVTEKSGEKACCLHSLSLATFWHPNLNHWKSYF